MTEPKPPGAVIVAGTFRAKRGVTLPVLAAMAAMSAASRAEDGCENYTYAVDAFDPMTIRVFEIWTDMASLNRHREANHTKIWRDKWNDLGLSDANLTSYEIDNRAPL
jgi:quinol monooxygenase YgiN